MRKVWGFSIACGLVLGHAAPVRAEPPKDALTVVLRCPAVDAPGRVRCSAEITAGEGARVPWADLVLLPTPEGLAPLRARIGPQEAAEARDARWRFDLAVVARRRGEATLGARVRAVVCVGERCAPAVREVTATVSVRE